MVIPKSRQSRWEQSAGNHLRNGSPATPRIPPRRTRGDVWPRRRLTWKPRRNRILPPIRSYSFSRIFCGGSGCASPPTFNRRTTLHLFRSCMIFIRWTTTKISINLPKATWLLSEKSIIYRGRRLARSHTRGSWLFISAIFCRDDLVRNCSFPYRCLSLKRQDEFMKHKPQGEVTHSTFAEFIFFRRVSKFAWNEQLNRNRPFYRIKIFFLLYCLTLASVKRTRVKLPWIAKY